MVWLLSCHDLIADKALESSAKGFPDEGKIHRGLLSLQMRRGRALTEVCCHSDHGDHRHDGTCPACITF